MANAEAWKRRVQVPFLIGVVLLCLASIADVLVKSDPLSKWSTAVLFVASVVLITWFAIRYVDLIVDGIVEPFGVWINNLLIVLTALVLSRFSESQSDWYNTCGFLFTFAFTKEVATFKSFRDRGEYEQADYHFRTMTTDLLIALTCFFISFVSESQKLGLPENTWNWIAAIVAVYATSDSYRLWRRIEVLRARGIARSPPAR